MQPVEWLFSGEHEFQMPITQFDKMPGTARLWVFAARNPLRDNDSSGLLKVVDWFLEKWNAHGIPLLTARDWRDSRFLAIAVDEAATGASGCSIDGLFRTLSSMEERLGTSMIGAGHIFWRNPGGEIQAGTRAEFKEAARRGEISSETTVFDLTVTNVESWREHFERPVALSWHARLISA